MFFVSVYCRRCDATCAEDERRVFTLWVKLWFYAVSRYNHALIISEYQRGDDNITCSALPDCCPLTLDVNSAYVYLSLSQENRRATSSSCDNYYGSHSDRFTSIKQVLCREGLSKRCYWEVIRSGCTCSVAVSYKDINRSSSDSEFGNNNKSWSLDCSQQGYSFRHNKGSKTVSGPRSSKIGVYLDYRAGTLSFYSISDTMTLLHKENTTFTQPLYPGLGVKDVSCWPSSGSYAELIKLWWLNIYSGGWSGWNWPFNIL